MDSGTRSLVRKIAAYRVLGWTAQRIAKTVRTSKSNVCRILNTEECRIEIERVHRQRICTLEAMLTSSGIKALRRLCKLGKEAEDDGHRVQANVAMLAAAVRGLGHRAAKDEAKPTANQVTFVHIADAVPPSPSPSEPPSS